MSKSSKPAPAPTSGPGTRGPDRRVKPIALRLEPETLGEIDALADRLGLSTRAAVVRHLVRRAYLTPPEK